ncbi:MAG TPA: zinc ribbon domain-containing protein [Symbiobacteriaceae bacterium]
MPIYEFRCDACGHHFDELLPMNTAGDNVKCPECGHVGATKSRGSWLNAAHGLENGHIAVGWKLTGKSSKPSSESSESKTSCCGGSCSCN